jgi:hypothetical protein
MRMIMERGSLEELRINQLTQQVHGLEQRLELVEAELAALRTALQARLPEVTAVRL